MNKQIELNGSKIMYRVAGQGKPVLLLHGFGETGDVWRKVAASLSKDFLVIVPDLPGSGESGIVPDMSMEGLAGIIKEIAEKELAAEKFTLIGHSMGGYIAMAFLELFPERLHALGLFHSTSRADSDEKKETRQKGIEFIQKNGAFEFLKTSTPNLFSAITKDERPGLIDVFLRGLHNFSADALVLYYKAMMQRPDRNHLLESSPVPILFVLGKYDNAVPFDDTLKLVHLPEKVYIHILYRSGHMGMLEEDDKSEYILHKFLSET